MSRLRACVGPVLVGTAVWCATGALTVASSSGSERLAVPAPLWVWLAGIAVAALVPAWRRDARLAWPALFSTLPWWPVPLPVAALIWTGPLAWAPILAAAGVAFGSRPLAEAGRMVGALEPKRATVLAAILTLMAGSLAAWSAAPRVPGGDEPHYLVITQSLLMDGDLRIENNHQRRDYAAYFEGTLAPDFLRRGQDNAIYSIHAPGVSALVLPAFGLFGYRGAQVFLLAIFAVTGAWVWRLGWRATSDAGAAWFAWAGVTISTTAILLSFMVFPDSPAALGVAAGAWLVVRLTSREGSVAPRALLTVSALLAALPWLHTRFAMLSAGFGLACAVAILADASRPWRARGWRMVLLLVVPVVSAIAWLMFFYAIYGTVDPRAPYGGGQPMRSWIWGAVLGLVADQQFGLLTYSPILAAAAMGMWAADRRVRLACLAGAGIGLAYVLAVATYHMWWAGVPALPARFLAAILPLFAVPLAVAWRQAALVGRTGLLALLSVSLGITTLVVSVDPGVLAWNGRDGQSAWLEWLGPLVNLPRAWPSFFWTTERAFITHTAAVVLIAVAGWWLVRQLARRTGGSAANVRLIVCGVWLLGVMASAEAGWRLNGSTGLDPARSQLALHAAAAHRPAVALSALRVQRHAVTTTLVVRGEEPRVDRPQTALLFLASVPAGRYWLRVTGGRPVTGDLTVTVGLSTGPLATFGVGSRADEDLPLMLPAGAAGLTVSSDAARRVAGISVALVPRERAMAVPGLARRTARYGDVDVFFLDDDVFAEPEGFWVCGRCDAEVVLARGPAGRDRPHTLLVQNGSVENTITLRSGTWTEVLRLTPGAERVVSLPQPDGSGAVRLSVASAEGFQPSAVSPSNDTRFLGVWIKP